MMIRWRSRLLISLVVSMTVATPVRAATIGGGTRSPGTDTGRILSVVEQAVGNKNVVRRVQRKLASLDEGRLRLLAALADRVEAGRDKPGADVALLLFAALIVFE